MTQVHYFALRKPFHKHNSEKKPHELKRNMSYSPARNPKEIESIYGILPTPPPPRQKTSSTETPMIFMIRATPIKVLKYAANFFNDILFGDVPQFENDTMDFPEFFRKIAKSFRHSPVTHRSSPQAAAKETAQEPPVVATKSEEIKDVENMAEETTVVETKAQETKSVPAMVNTQEETTQAPVTAIVLREKKKSTLPAFVRLLKLEVPFELDHATLFRPIIPSGKRRLPSKWSIVMQ
jgi:hypothetical protein